MASKEPLEAQKALTYGQTGLLEADRVYSKCC